MIAIYEGPGARWRGDPHPRLSKEEILRGELDRYQLFIMPGGRDVPYHATLQGEANAQIRAFVEQGGTYLGICAGAYYGCAQVEFDKGFPLEVCGERELRFFSGTAVGPAYGKGTFSYHSERGARKAKLRVSEEILHIHYNGGCFFTGDFSKVRILAHYLDLPGEPPAILECPLGKGRAILSGVHLELGHFMAEDFPSDEVKMQMEDRLARIGAIIRH